MCILVLYVPWMLFQKIEFPPADRLLKWHLAGVIDITPLGLVPSLIEAYSEVSLINWFSDRWINFQTVFMGSTDFLADLFNGDFSAIKLKSFFNTSYSMLFFSPILLPVLMIFSFITPHKFAVPYKQIWVTLGGYFIWILLMMIPGSSVIHQGSLFLWLLLFLLTCLSVFNFDKRVYSVLCIFQICLSLAVFMPLKMDLLLHDVFVYYGWCFIIMISFYYVFTKYVSECN